MVQKEKSFKDISNLGPVVQKEKSFKDISNLEFWQPLFSGLEPFVKYWKKA